MILKGADETMKAKFLTVLVWVNLPVNGNLDSTDRIMNLSICIWKQEDTRT